jgi:hypothetical protein
MRLQVPYYRTGAAYGAFVCIRSVNAVAQSSTDHSCAPLSIPAQ